MPAEYAAQAAAYGYTALAVTDHDGLYGAMEFAGDQGGRNPADYRCRDHPG